ncbi:SoxR reducing system RseC family protein [Marinicella litoralis]|nr:SoxR reducing system RseC family protein [Marinicella litoralis]
MQNNHTVTLQLQQQEKCAGCPKNCNEPLFKLFSMKSNRIDLSTDNKQYQLIDGDHLLANKLKIGQLIVLNIDDSDLFRSSALLYFLPLLLILIGVSVGHFVGKWLGLLTDLSALMGLVIGLFTVVFIFKNKIMLKHLKFRPKVTILRPEGT